jgi:hypothetical protein
MATWEESMILNGDIGVEFLTPDVVVFVARAARHGGVSSGYQIHRVNSEPESLKAPLFVCAQFLRNVADRSLRRSRTT